MRFFVLLGNVVSIEYLEIETEMWFKHTVKNHSVGQATFREYLVERLKSSFRNVMVDTGILFSNMKSPSLEC